MTAFRDILTKFSKSVRSVHDEISIIPQRRLVATTKYRYPGEKKTLPFSYTAASCELQGHSDRRGRPCSLHADPRCCSVRKIVARYAYVIYDLSLRDLPPVRDCYVIAAERSLGADLETRGTCTLGSPIFFSLTRWKCQPIFPREGGERISIGGASRSGVQVLFPGFLDAASNRRGEPRRGAPRRRVSRVSGASVGVCA